MTPFRRGPATLALVALVGAGCGQGRDVNLGSLTLAAHDGGAPPTNDCGGRPCTEHRGSRVFIDASAAGTSPSAFDDGVEVPPGEDPDAEPVVLYPSDETRLPFNLPTVRFAWSPGRGAAFALDFVGPNTTVRVVTAATSFVPTDEQWEWIGEANRGGSLDVTVRALDADATGTVRRARARTLSLSAAPLDGTVYYWSTGGQGLMRAGFTASTAERFFTPPGGADAPTCTGCHTISRDGKRLAVGYDKNQLAEFALAERSVIVPLGNLGADAPPPPTADGGPPPPPDMMMPKADKPAPLAWSTFSPDGALLLAAGGGKLRLIDADTGVPVGPDQGAVPLPTGVAATHPDWSPLGDLVAVTLAVKGGDKQTEQGSIAVIPYAAGVFGEPQVLVPSAGDRDNNFFPTFSPDGRFIAYANARGGSQDARSADLRLVEVATKTVRELTRLNERVGADDGSMDLGNTMPTFLGPLGTDGTYWLSFSSLRAYADVRPADPKQDQLWIAGIDPSLDDVSFAAFWAPFQNLGQGNHRAFLAGAEGPTCSCLERCANGRDDDCDGEVDELDCAASCAAREICGNALDDDCDCVVDDCSNENCDDGSDNDGDGKADKMDAACMSK